MNLVHQTDRAELLRAENRAEVAEDALAYLKQEVAAAHSVLDFIVGRTTPYKGHGQRLMSLAERIDAAHEIVAKREEEGWEKYRQQMDANAALAESLKALRESFDKIEAENRKLSERRKEAA